MIANRFIYYPSRYPEGFWNLQDRLAAADVWLETRDRVRIHAWWVESPGSRLATVFFHGNAGNLTHRGEHFREIAAAGSSVLMIDYRGYGKSNGQPTEKGLYADAAAAYDELARRGYRPGSIVVHGESLGTAVAVELASRQPCAGLIVEAPFPSGKEVARTVFPVFGPMLVRSFDSQRKIARVRAPMLFIQGDRDEVIPFRLGQALYAAAPEPKFFHVVHGGGHNDIIEAAGPQYREWLRSFYEMLPSPL